MASSQKLFIISCSSVCAVIWLVIAITLLAVSFKDIRFDEYGLKYHTIEKELDDELEPEGRQTVQPGEIFFTFKRNSQTLTFGSKKKGTFASIVCLTKDGLEAELIVSLTYKLIAEQITTLFEEYSPSLKR